MKYAKQRVFLNAALAHEDVALGYQEDGWDVNFGPFSLGVLKHRGSEVIFRPSRGRVKGTREVSGMSSD